MMLILSPPDTRQLQAKILTGFRCNNRCLFCYDRRHTQLPEKTTEQLCVEMARARKSHFNNIHFLGGEPTIRNDFFKLAAFAKKLGFERVAVTTNGRMLQYRDFTKQALTAGINQFILSIHGPDAALHDRLTSCQGSFAQLIQAIKILRTLGAHNTRTNTTVVKQNYRFLPRIARLLLNEKIKKAEFIYVSARPKDFLSFTPKISLAAPFLRQALSLAVQKGLFWHVQNPPMPCLLGPYFSHASAAGVQEHFSFSKSQAARRYDASQKMKSIFWIKLKACRACARNAQCLGACKDYVEHYGQTEIKPYA